MTTRRIRLWTLTSLAILAVLPLAGCGRPRPVREAPDRLRVVAAENFYGELVAAIGGDRVGVQSILSNAIQSPEDFQPTAAEARAVSDADLVVYNGLGYDAWAERALASGGKAGRAVINVGRDVLGRGMGDNPHLWYDATTMPKLAERVASVLAELDPARADFFRIRAGEYVAALRPFLDQVARVRQAEPVPVAVSEPVAEYLLRALNFEVRNGRFAQAVFSGAEPAPRDVGLTQSLLEKRQVAMFIYNPKTKTRDVDRMVAIAEAAGVPVVAVTEQMPDGMTYVTWMAGQLSEIERALGGG